MVDSVSARVKYSNLDRSSDFKLGNAGANANSSDYMFRFQTAFDAQDLKQDKWKVHAATRSPIEFLDLGLEFIWKDNDYREARHPRPPEGQARRGLRATCPTAIRPPWRFTVFGD